jgi:hypothetical protein
VILAARTAMTVKISTRKRLLKLVMISVWNWLERMFTILMEVVMALSVNPFLNIKKIEKGVWFLCPHPPIF